MELALTDVKYKEKSTDYSHLDNLHPDAELYYVDRGAVHIVIDRTVDFTLTQGEACVFLPNELHSTWAERDKAPNILDIHFSATIPDLALLHHRCLVLGTQQHQIMHMIIKEIETRDDYSGEITSCLLWWLVHSLLRQVRQNRDPQVNPLGRSENLRNVLVRQVKEYIEAHLGEQLSLDRISHLSCVSASHLSHTFSAVEGRGLIEYIGLRRLARAKELLRDSDLSVTDIAAAVGFSSIHYFSRVFKSKTGFTPSQYCRSIR